MSLDKFRPMLNNQSDLRRYKAFRCPLSYVGDQICGYQGDADKFKIFRMAKGLLPEGFKIVGVYFEHPRNDFYFMIEHPSFPEVASGEKMEGIEITLEEIEVQIVPDDPEPRQNVRAVQPLHDLNWVPIETHDPDPLYDGWLFLCADEMDKAYTAAFSTNFKSTAVCLPQLKFWRYVA